MRISGRQISKQLNLSLGFFVFLGLSAYLCGQTLDGSLVGTVTDPSGAVVPNATVVATDVGTAQTRQDTTDPSGRYNIVNLQPGTYTVTVSAAGFRKLEQTNITITPNTVSRSDVRLEVGQATEQVTVSAEAVELQTDKADTHTEISSTAVANLPISGSGYRNYQTLIDLTPGAQPSTFYNSMTDVPGIPQNTHINGGNGQTNITTIDGAESVNVWLPQYTGYVAPAETIDVVNVTTSSADASQGLAGSSAITVVTKSGTNQLHGSAFEYHNDQHLNARNFFLSPTAAKPVAIYNNYGGSIGGRIVKDKLFYFGSFDGTNQKLSGNGLYTVPTADQRAGNLSASPTAIYNPFTGNPDGSGRSVFAGKIIPAALISSQALKLQSYFPAPNLPGIVNNYAATAGPILNRYQTDVKVNWNRTEKNMIFFKYDNMVATSGGNGIFGVAGGPTPSGDPGTGHTTVQVAAIGTTYTFSPNVVLDANVGYERLNQNVKGTDFGTNYGPVLGIPGLNGSDIRDSGFPDIFFGSNNFYTNFGVPNWMPLFRTDETYTNNEKLTWTKGAHELTFGFDLVRHHLNHWQPELSAGGPRGYFDFNGSITTDNASGAASPNQFNAYAQFLLGLSDNTQKGEQYILMTGREWQFGWFAQDRWQATRNLTVTLGLRYELYPLMTRCCGTGIESYDPSNNNVYMGGRGSVPENAYVTVSHKLFAPRAGIAWRLNDSTVIRTGYGLNYDPLPYSRPWRGFYPLTINNNYSGANAYVPATGAPSLAAGIPPIIGPNLSTGIVPLDPTAEERAPLAGELKRGYIQSWNFTVEHKFPGQIVASAGYVGQKSTHLLADYDLNAGYPGSGTHGLPLYQAFGDTSPVYNSSGYLSSNYNSLQIAVNRQFANGLMLKGAYTWSHAINYTNDDGWAEMTWYGDQFSRNYATAGYDRTQVFQLGWVYELPFGKGKRFLNTGLASAIIGGWQFSGIESCYTGQPYTVTASGTSLNAPDQTQTANQVGPVQFIGAVGPGSHYYSPSAFAPVTTVSYGNVGRNTLRGPGVWNTDVSVVRDFPIKERLRLQFRAEFYNLPNTSHFNQPNTNVNSSSFMQVTSSYGERNIRFAVHAQF
ncbi:MAG: TonB-dependent receptor [Acidobacteriaceae bacterium]|nr:TonB-dependent receptor [Acidobacteriaceae bacterium]